MNLVSEFSLSEVATTSRLCSFLLRLVYRLDDVWLWMCLIKSSSSRMSWRHARRGAVGIQLLKLFLIQINDDVQGVVSLSTSFLQLCLLPLKSNKKWIFLDLKLSQSFQSCETVICEYVWQHFIDCILMKHWW